MSSVVRNDCGAGTDSIVCSDGHRIHLSMCDKLKMHKSGSDDTICCAMSSNTSCSTLKTPNYVSECNGHCIFSKHNKNLNSQLTKWVCYDDNDTVINPDPSGHFQQQNISHCVVEADKSYTGT